MTPHNFSHASYKDSTYSNLPHGFLFDMDGVLLIADQSPAQTWQQVALQFAPRLDTSLEALIKALQESRSVYKHEIEGDFEKQRRDRLEPFETRLEVVLGALEALNKVDKNRAEEMVHMYESLRDTHRQLAPHSLQLLRELRARAFPLALISNGNATYQRRKISQHQLEPFFDLILIEEEFGVEKPNPRIFRHALEQLHISAHETWMIGDDLERDIAGSQQVGIFAIWCDFTQQGLPAKSLIHPNWVIHDLLEIHVHFH